MSASGNDTDHGHALINADESAMSNSKSNRTTFRKGRRKTGGRQRGIPNKTTGLLRDALVLAAEAVGNEKNGGGLVGYFKWAATEHTASYLQLFGRAMPQRFEMEQTSHTEIFYRSVAEIRQELIERGVPVEVITSALIDENSGEQQQHDKCGQDLEDNDKCGQDPEDK